MEQDQTEKSIKIRKYKEAQKNLDRALVDIALIKKKSRFYRHNKIFK